MMTLENAIDVDTEALQMFAEDFRNVSVVHNSLARRAVSAGKCSSVDPPQYLGPIERTAPEICLPEAQQKKVAPAQVSARFGGSRSRSFSRRGANRR
jgi:hypothetical protein